MARFVSVNIVARRSIRTRRTSVTACFAVALLFVALPARSATPGENRAAAAAAFDDGIARFEQADYAAAARLFLKADELAPSVDAITNAIAAARKANDQLLVVEAAERGVKRAAGSPTLATTSREALLEAARSLSRLDLSCEPSPCTLSLDGAPTEAGNRYALPGTHLVATAAMDGNPSQEQLSVIPGAAYRVVLHAVKRGESAQAANVSTETPGVRPQPTARSQEPEQDHAPAAPKKPLSPTVFYVGVGVTAVLAGLGTWSGIDTLSAEGKVSKDDVYAKAHRSDFLWGGAVVVGALTATSGFLWVEWGDTGKQRRGEEGGGSACVVPLPGGAMAAAQGTF